MFRIIVIIPAYNEGGSIGKVVADIPAIVDEIIVVNNSSTDNTAMAAEAAGATVLAESRAGYGYACLKGMEYVAHKKIKPDIIVFMDGDYSDYPEELEILIAPIVENDIDFVIGSRTKKLRAPGSMTVQQVFGNGLATFLMKIIYSSKFTDLGPFRAIKYDKLLRLQMTDKTYGWTVEMQLKVLKQKMSYVEIPVMYRKRIGVSKVSGTLKGSVLAGIKIISWIVKYGFK